MADCEDNFRIQSWSTAEGRELVMVSLPTDRDCRIAITYTDNRRTVYSVVQITFLVQFARCAAPLSESTS
ncbi:hypothetical protein J6590_016817 [Homalodisca vitripennis]|nr:hypothetical protein J6590_016817 [Homalodisca vitripennis]